MFLIRLPTSFPYDINRIKLAIESFPANIGLAFEFRYINFRAKEVIDLLRHYNCSFYCPDSPREIFESVVSSKTLYTRLRGRVKWFNGDYLVEQ